MFCGVKTSGGPRTTTGLFPSLTIFGAALANTSAVATARRCAERKLKAIKRRPHRTAMGFRNSVSRRIQT